MKRILFYLAVNIPVFLGAISLTYAQITKEPIGVSDTLSPTDTRKSFGYCPIDTDTQTVLDKYGVTYSIESCPLSRIYVDNWDKLDSITQQAIVDELSLKGYRMEKE